MLKGHVFKFQTFANEVFAHFINTFLQNNMGVTKGCELSNTTNSVSIDAGYFCIYGRFLEIVGAETISDITNTGYYNLICEIDLSKTNTKSELNQATIKVIRNTSGYSTLVKEDLENGGNIYQYEFARFRVTEAGIVNFQDKRTFLNLNSLYSQINNNFNNLFKQKDEAAENLIEQIRQELASIVDGSAYALKEEVEGTKLYTDFNGTTSNISLTNNLSNYKYIEIDVGVIGKLYAKTYRFPVTQDIRYYEKPISLEYVEPASSSNTILHVVHFMLTDTTMSRKIAKTHIFANSSISTSTSSNLLIFEIRGYKH